MQIKLGSVCEETGLMGNLGCFSMRWRRVGGHWWTGTGVGG